MAHDERLAERIRALVVDDPDVTEQRMFGGVAFLVGGQLAVSASGQGDLMVLVDPQDTDRLVASTPARPMEMRGRAMQGWLRVDVDAVTTKRSLARWVGLGTAYARSLPPKH